MTFEELGVEVNDAVMDNSDIIRISVADVAQTVSQSTHDLMHDIAISDEVAAIDPGEYEPVPAIQTAPGTLAMPQMKILEPGAVYQPQNADMTSILSQLQNVQRLQA